MLRTPYSSTFWTALVSLAALCLIIVISACADQTTIVQYYNEKKYRAVQSYRRPPGGVQITDVWFNEQGHPSHKEYITLATDSTRVLDEWKLKLATLNIELPISDTLSGSTIYYLQSIGDSSNSHIRSFNEEGFLIDNALDKIFLLNSMDSVIDSITIAPPL